MTRLSPEEKKKLWLGPEFEQVKNSYDILTGQDTQELGGPPKDKNGGDTKTEIPTRAKSIITSFINTYDYILSGMFSNLAPCSDWSMRRKTYSQI